MNIPKKDQKIIAVVLLALVVIVLIFYSWDSPVCSGKNCDVCSKSCSSDQECKFTCSCGCVKDGFEEECEELPCYSSCVCVNGECANLGDTFEKAVSNKDAGVCNQIGVAECKDYCLETVENEKKKEELFITTKKDVYRVGEEITVSVDNTGETVLFSGFSVLAFDGEWKEIQSFFECVPGLNCSDNSCAELGSANWTWNQKTYSTEGNITTETNVPAGHYRIQACYSKQSEPGACKLIDPVCVWKQVEIKPLSIIFYTKGIQDGQAIQAEITNNGPGEIQFNPDFVKVGSLTNPGLEEKLDELYENFSIDCSPDCSQVVLQEGQSKTLGLSADLEPGRYHLITLINDAKRVYSNSFKVIPDLTPFSSDEKYCEENIDCVGILDEQAFCCGSSTDVCVNALSPKIDQEFNPQCEEISCPSNPTEYSCTCVNGQCTSMPL